MNLFGSPVSEANRRVSARRRTRLRPVKLLTGRLSFLADGSALDLSPKGARILCHAETPMPQCLSVLDEVDETIRPAILVWSCRAEVGLHFTGPARRASRADVLRLTGRYYALED